MANELEEIPLFPLNTVLFPHSELMVHVFEDRYREMTRKCLQSDSGFGICLIRSGSEVGDTPDPYMVGTMARIVSAQSYDDGRIDLRVRGERRFRIRKIDDSQEYLIGHVEWIHELPLDDSPRTDALAHKTREFLEQYIVATFEQTDIRVAKIQFPQDPTALSFRAAAFLNIEPIRKQHLLETTDTNDRISEILPVLEDHLLHAQEMKIIEAEIPDTVRLSSQDFEDMIVNN